MKIIEHEYFGKLNLDMEEDVEVIWERSIQGIDTWLWYSRNVELPKELLDFYAYFLEHLNEKIGEAREALVEQLKKDGEYIHFHMEESGFSDLPKNIVDFVMKMSVTNIGLWIDAGVVITMDFMILPEESDEILCVKFDKTGNIVAVDWES